MHLVPLLPTPAALPMLFVGIAIVALGIFVLARERASEVTLSFLVLSITVSIWLISVSAMIVVASDAAAFTLARVAYFGIALIPAAVLHFSVALLSETQSRRSLLVTNWSIGLAFALLFTRSNLLLAGTWHYKWGFYPHLTMASAVFLTWFGIVLGGALRLLLKTPTKSEQERRRSRAFVVALSIAYIATIDYLPSFGVPLYPLGCIAILGFIVIAARSILRLRLTDISPSFVADRLLQTMHGGVIVVDIDGVVRLTNHVAAHLLGWTIDEMVDLDLRRLLGVSILPVTDSDSFIRRSFARSRLVNWRRRDGSEIEIALSASALRDERGDPVGILYALSDVSDRRRAEANEYGATHDLLTRLPNRVRFNADFEEQKERIAAQGRTPAVLFIDLDGFKTINDRYGHNVGDVLLQLVAARLRNAVRGTDSIARYGGDEFVLMLDLASPNDVALVAAKLTRLIGAEYTVDAFHMTIGASIGAAFYPTNGTTTDELIRAADAAMYEAKRSGKGHLEIAREAKQRRDDIAAPPPYGVDARI